MKESETGNFDLNRLGPFYFFQWLLPLLEDSGALETDSKKNVKLLLENKTMDRYSIHSLEYEKLITALHENDFRIFVEEQLESAQSIHLTVEELFYKGDPLSLSTLKTLLTSTFHRDHIFPQQGLGTLLREALEAMSEARDAVKSICSNTNIVMRHISAETIHSGVDRALIATERYLELLVEFLSLLAKNHYRANQDSVNKWLGTIKCTWGQKEGVILDICSEIKKLSGNLEVSPDLQDIAAKIANVFAENGDQENDACPVRKLFRELRLCRNKLRHISHTLVQGVNLPSGFDSTINESVGYLTELVKLSELFQPITVKIVSYDRDLYGHIGLKLSTENHQIITAKFSRLKQRTLIDLDQISKEFNKEYFLYPAPVNFSSHIYDPLIVRRELKSDDDLLLNYKLQRLLRTQVKQEIPLQE